MLVNLLSLSPLHRGKKFVPTIPSLLLMILWSGLMFDKVFNYHKVKICFETGY